MSKKQPTWILKSIRLPERLLKKIDFYAKEYQVKNGFQISQSAIIRTFLEEGLTTRGITDNVYDNSTRNDNSSEGGGQK